MSIANAFCPTREVLNLIADRWSLLVILFLAERPHRFNELLHKVEGISQRMLTVTLRRLEMDGLVTRTIVSGRPVKISYALTELGASLKGLVNGVRDWAEANVEEIMANRKVFVESNNL